VPTSMLVTELPSPLLRTACVFFPAKHGCTRWSSVYLRRRVSRSEVREIEEKFGKRVNAVIIELVHDHYDRRVHVQPAV